VLETAELFWISTIRADGRPHMTPLVAVWLDGALYFTTGATEQKALNLRENPDVILMTGCNHWDAGLDVVVEGLALSVVDRALLKHLAAAWVTKWDGRWQYEGRDSGLFHTNRGMALVFEVKPTKILAFAKGTFSHIRYQF
jgi:general stress protein 26